MHFLVTRPQADSTAATLRAAGHDATLAPLMQFEAVAWQAEPAEAIMLTSPQGARCAAPAAAWHVPAYAVGAATAAAALAAGFEDVRDGGGTAQALVDRIAADGFVRVVHLAGADRTAVAVPDGLRIDVVTVYRAALVPLAAVPAADWVLLYSARTAAHLAHEIDRLGVLRSTTAIGVLSAAIAAAAGPGWRAVVVADAPNEAALLAAIDAACQKTPDSL
ncbi:MAG: uroporphyrinogen-III synthase [Sandarakinorhabdus sp.]|nr:uroporphyrinogen-III synthase [Sandarakinorhabdus sp.]